MNTPWGKSQEHHERAPGIVFHSTASHGGYQLSPKRWRELKEIFPKFEPWAEEGWLEEDCDYALAVWCWPEYFEDITVYYLMKSITTEDGNFKLPKWMPPSFLASPQWKTISERAQHWEKENRENWTHGSKGTTDERGIWNVLFTQVGSGRKIWVKMPYPEKSIWTTSELEQFPYCESRL